MRVRIPLPTEARNAPRRADAESERTRAEGELIQTRRVVAGEVGLARRRCGRRQARRGWPPSAGGGRPAAGAARRAFRAGEIGVFDLFRVRQLQIEAAAVDARAQVDVGRARSG